MNDKPKAPPQPQQAQPQGDQYFMVPAVAMGAALEILQDLPWKKVSSLIPTLMGCQRVTGTPKPEEK